MTEDTWLDQFGQPHKWGECPCGDVHEFCEDDEEDCGDGFIVEGVAEAYLPYLFDN